jgi:dipeptidyl aminopeptidase
MVPLTSSSTVNDEPKIAYAAWSPTGHKIASYKTKMKTSQAY